MNAFPQNQKIKSYLAKIDSHIKQNHQLLWQKYVRLGSQNIKLVCYSKEFTALIEKQLSYVLQDSVDNFTATIVLWHEKEIAEFASTFIDNHIKSRILVHEDVIFEMIAEMEANRKILTRFNIEKELIKNFEIIDEAYSRDNPLIRISGESGIINAYDQEQNVYYYGVKDLHPEEFIKQGHIFVQIFNKILKTSHTALTHGAVVGLNNQGILLCGRGQRGKSTLAVVAMMQGFDYVSDDYLVLEKEGDALYSYPIYSIITLSPRMYNELYDDMKGKFVSNNARRDKYVIDIKAYHDSFREKYPIKVCVFPQITNDEKPSIVPCKKGRAITQLVHSTIIQMEDKHDIKTIQKLTSFIKDFDFYQINLCADIKANVECLRQFCSQINQIKTN